MNISLMSLPFIILILIRLSATFANETNLHNCTTHLSKTLTECTQASVIINLIGSATTLLEDAKKIAAVRSSCSASDDLKREKPIDCAEVLENNPGAVSGVYKIWLRNRVIKDLPVNVFCDMQDDNGGWTVIQRRGNFDSPKEYFNRNWEIYKHGFGDRIQDFWLGNENIFALTNQRLNSVKFIITDWDGKEAHATYDNFWIDDESRNYTMHVTGYKGTAGDSFSNTHGKQFSTLDRDNDDSEKNCAVKYKSAWWFDSCFTSNLNGLYMKESKASFGEGVQWGTFRGYEYSLRDSVIKIRPSDFKNSQAHMETIPL